MGKLTTQKIKPVKAWAGISEGKLHCWESEPRYYEIYPTRKQVRVSYEEYTEVLITPVRKRARKARR